MKKAIKEGEIKLGNITIKVAVLEDGTRVIDARSIEKMLFDSNAVFTSEEAVDALKELNNL